MKDFDPLDWYWVVAESTTQVFSSAAGNYVPVDNDSYVAWLADGTTPSQIISEADLGEALALHRVRPTGSNVLSAYQDSHAKKLTLEVVAKVLFQIVNELRVLKGQPQITAQQFRNYVKGLM